MAERNKLAQIPSQQMPERQSNLLSQLWDEATGAFARYGRRSGAQRDASLALLNQAVDPNTDPLTGAGMKALGLAGLITHPLAFFPTGDEWRERLANAGNTSRLGQSVGGMLGDLPSLIDPHLVAGGGVLAAAPLVGKLGKGRGLSDLMGDATDAELAALKARLEAEAMQTGGEASGVSREEALKNLTEAATPKEFRTQSYKTVAEDGTTQWVPGTLRANPSTVPRFESSMSLADIKRYIDQYGEAPKPRDKTELVTQSYKEVYPDGTVKFAPGTLRTKRLTSPVDGGALAMAPLAAKMAKPSASAVRVLPTDVTGYSRGESFGNKILHVDGKPQAVADLSIFGDTVYINNIQTADGSRRGGLASKLMEDIFSEFPDKRIAVTNMTDDGSAFFRKNYDIDEEGYLTKR